MASLAFFENRAFPSMFPRIFGIFLKKIKPLTFSIPNLDL